METARAQRRMSATPMPYRDRPLALLTQHGKERVIAPALEPVLGCRITLVTGYDTDLLGSFTRVIPRAGTQLEAARRKAELGLALSGLPTGLASEGGFGPDPMAGLFPWNVEIVLLLDRTRGLEVVGRAQGPARHLYRLVEDWPAVEAFAREAGFPEHHLVVRPDSPDDPRLRKGIADWPALEAAWHWAIKASAGGRVWLENDLRAHANPTRMAMIARAAEDLAVRLSSCCPACGTPGYASTARIPGLPCADCGAPTREPRAEVWACLKCDQRETRPVSGPALADPGRCDLCNP
jgi:hypothetical protein